MILKIFDYNLSSVDLVVPSSLFIVFNFVYPILKKHMVEIFKLKEHFNRKTKQKFVVNKFNRNERNIFILFK